VKRNGEKGSIIYSAFLLKIKKERPLSQWKKGKREKMQIKLRMKDQ
jgi:hypothetical protein